MSSTTTEPTTTEQVVTMVAGALLTLATRHGGTAFNDPTFRTHLYWSKTDQTEQDHCFNELVVTAIGYAYYRLDDELLPQELWEFAELIRKAFPSAYHEQLLEMGMVSEFADQWLQLMDMRLKEYGENIEEMGPQLRLDMANDDNDDSSPEVKQLTIRLSLMTTAGLQHLRRGKLDEKDPLRKYLRAWLFELEKELHPMMEKMSAIATHEYEPEEH